MNSCVIGMVPLFMHGTPLWYPFLWMGFNWLKAREPLWGGNLLFMTKFPEIPGTHLIELRRIKCWVNHGFTHQTPELVIQHLNHYTTTLIQCLNHHMLVGDISGSIFFFIDVCLCVCQLIYWHHLKNFNSTAVYH